MDGAAPLARDVRLLAILPVSLLKSTDFCSIHDGDCVDWACMPYVLN